MLIQTLRLWRSNDIDTTFSTRKYESWSEGSLKWSEDEETSVYTFVIIFAKKAVGEVRDPWNTGTEETFKLLPLLVTIFSWYVVVNIVFMDNSFVR